GSFRPLNAKPALTLNFDKFADKQRFHGLQKISLNNSVQDPSYVSEKICRDIYGAAGVLVPRADYATVELNGRQLGLFVLTEGWNKQFLRRHFANVKGNFYDLANSRDIERPIEATSGENPTNHAPLIALLEAANEPDHRQRLARLKQTLDLDRFLTQHALDVLMWNWDGYGLNRNNYRVFHDRGSDRVVFFPHGLDQMFWKPNGPIVTGRSGVVVRSLLETAEGRRLYLNRFKELRTNVFDVRALTNRIAELTRRLQPTLAKEGNRAVAQQRDAAEELTELILARGQDVDVQLASVKSFSPLELNATRLLTNWITRRDSGQVTFSRTTNSPPALRLQANNIPSLGSWTTTVWLEEGRYRVEGRVKTLGVQSSIPVEGGAGFRVWSGRKDTRGASWSWFPYANGRDPRAGGLIPVTTDSPPQRLNGDAEWTTVTHEFELRQPLADVQIQCALQASAGAAWFDPASVKIRRVSLNVSKSRSRGD
ncbi:MAG TPA: CotH kinase family protein, partial [Candidatus Limnocylindria bacterium]|nr:CotH kinase family protein [Candidatus Limnocylindria bacterium]